jgi:hypothetical protein
MAWCSVRRSTGTTLPLPFTVSLWKRKKLKSHFHNPVAVHVLGLAFEPVQCNGLGRGREVNKGQKVQVGGGGGSRESLQEVWLAKEDYEYL